MSSIMRAARAVFCEKGYREALTVEIATRAGVVEGSIYRYFDGKRDLLIKVVEEWYRQTLASYDAELRGVHGTRQRLRFMIWKHLSILRGEPEMCRLVLRELRPDPDYRDTVVYELNREYTRRTIDIVEQGIRDGELRADAPRRIVRDLIFGGIEHLTWSYLRHEGDFSPEEAADSITDLLYRGLAEQGADDGDESQTAAPDVALRRLENVTSRLELLAARNGATT